jgi:hypothetical protein
MKETKRSLTIRLKALKAKVTKLLDLEDQGFNIDYLINKVEAELIEVKAKLSAISAKQH